ncbi:MAG: hypothetical protein WDN06_01460 [Asticcacaulis sp.]
MGGDAPPGMYKAPVGYCTNLQFSDPARWQARVRCLARMAAAISCPWGETFWSKGFGMCVDRFDQHWMINTGELM